MHTIEYDIYLNDEGRPYIYLPENYEHNPEDRFFALEIANYVLRDVYGKRSSDFDKDTEEKLSTTIGTLTSISDQVAGLIKKELIGIGEMHTMASTYSFSVNYLEELQNLKDEIVKDNMIFIKEEGLKVWVNSENKIYVFTNDIANIWEENEKVQGSIKY
jgi:hypothetical protein